MAADTAPVQPAGPGAGVDTRSVKEHGRSFTAQPECPPRNGPRPWPGWRRSSLQDGLGRKSRLAEQQLRQISGFLFHFFFLFFFLYLCGRIPACHF